MSLVPDGSLSEEVENINSVVDQCFSFIYDEPVSDDDTDFLPVRHPDMPKGKLGCPLSPAPNVAQADVEKELYEHFSFLNRENFYSSSDCISNSPPSPWQSSTHENDTDGYSGARLEQKHLLKSTFSKLEHEPIYSNVGQRSVRPKTKTESEKTLLNLPSEDSHLYENVQPNKKILADEQIVNENIYQRGNSAVIEIGNDKKTEVGLGVSCNSQPNESEMSGETKNSACVYVVHDNPPHFQPEVRDPPLTINLTTDPLSPRVYAFCFPKHKDCIKAAHSRNHPTTKDVIVPKVDGISPMVESTNDGMSIEAVKIPSLTQTNEEFDLEDKLSTNCLVNEVTRKMSTVHEISELNSKVTNPDGTLIRCEEEINGMIKRRVPKQNSPIKKLKYSTLPLDNACEIPYTKFDCKPSKKVLLSTENLLRSQTFRIDRLKSSELPSLSNATETTDLQSTDVPELEYDSTDGNFSSIETDFKDISSSERDLETLRQLDLEFDKLENMDNHSPSTTAVEAYNVDSMPAKHLSGGSWRQNMNSPSAIISAEHRDTLDPVEKESSYLSHIVDFELAKRTICHVGMTNSEPKEPSADVASGVSHSNGESVKGMTSDDNTLFQSAAGEAEGSLASSISGVIRRSMRRMKHIKLSGRRSKRQRTRDPPDQGSTPYNLSEETEVRRQLPTVPQLGLPSVRSPAASAVLLPSLLAVLSPNEPPRESLPSPENLQDQPVNTASRAHPNENLNRSCGSNFENVSRNDAVPGSLTCLEGTSWIVPIPTRRTGGLQSSSESSRSGNSEIHSATPRGDRVATSPLGSASTCRSPVSLHGRNRRNGNTRTRPSGSNGQSRERRPRCEGRTERVTSTTGGSGASNNEARAITGESTSRQSLRRAHRRDLAENTQRIGSPSGQQGFSLPKRIHWPHRHSGLLAALPVTLNMFNISRFAVLGAQFGWQFPVQWLIMSIIIGLPLMTFHAAIGQSVGGSVVDMWVISPIFQGLGFALIFAEIVIGIYCSVPVAWLFTYFRDSFDLMHFGCLSKSDCESPGNLTKEINTFVPAYFSSSVLQRSDNGATVLSYLGSVKFDLSFNVAVVWIITFMALSRGTRTYGKVCYLICLLPLVCYLSVSLYLAYWMSTGLDIKQLVTKFIDRQSWLSASREAFLVWGLHGPVIQQMAAGNKKKQPLWRDTTSIALMTILGLCLAGFCGLLCVSVLEGRGLNYRPSSFETKETRSFVDVQIYYKDTETILMERNEILGPPQYLRPEPVFDNFYVGIRIRDEYLFRISPRLESYRSGYNCLRFMTELFPAMLFAKEGDTLSLWPPVFYLSLLLFGLAHQFAVWHTVVQGVLRMNHKRFIAWETFISFCCCLFGFSAALVMTTGAGIHIIYFLDYCIGSVWWIMILQLIMVFAVLFVRGKPFSAKEVAITLFGENKFCSSPWTITPAAFAWTILVPVGLLVLSISFFKTGNYREVFAWSSTYWSTWTCQLASGLQLFPLLLVPLVGLIQTCRFLADPRYDLFERIRHLYRPPPYNEDEDPLAASSLEDLDGIPLPISAPDSNDDLSPSRPHLDPPPKYTPPPSYSVATGSGFRRLKNTLRNQPTMSTERLDIDSHPQATLNPSGPYIPPPDYSQQIFENLEAPGSPNSPPLYATLDPMRMRRAINGYYKSSQIGPLGFTNHQRGVDSSNCRYCGAYLGLNSSTREEAANDDSRQASEEAPKCSESKGISHYGFAGVSSGTGFYGQNNRYHPGEEGNPRNSRGVDIECANPQCPGPSTPSFIRNFSRTSGNSFRRSLTSSLRRSARRLAEALMGSSGEGSVLVSHASSSRSEHSRSLSNLELSTQSEA